MKITTIAAASLVVLAGMTGLAADPAFASSHGPAASAGDVTTPPPRGKPTSTRSRDEVRGEARMATKDGSLPDKGDVTPPVAKGKPMSTRNRHEVRAEARQAAKEGSLSKGDTTK